MRESPFFRAIPMQLLQRYIEEDRKHIDALDQVDLVGPLQTGACFLAMLCWAIEGKKEAKGGGERSGESACVCCVCVCECQTESKIDLLDQGLPFLVSAF